jgi:MFS transporter, MHS family, proline/betaine transporter
VAGLNVLTAIGFYLMFVYAVTCLEQVMHIRAATALDINTFNMGVLLLAMPAAVALSDRIGRKPVLLGSGLALLVLAWPLFWLLHHPVWSLMLLGQLGFALLLGLYSGVLCAALAEALPARVRVSALAIGCNLSVGILGGMTPMAMTALLAWSHNPLAPTYVLMGATAVSLAVLISWPETAQAPWPEPRMSAAAGRPSSEPRASGDAGGGGRLIVGCMTKRRQRATRRDCACADIVTEM